jgi:hypothetical protein
MHKEREGCMHARMLVLGPTSVPDGGRSVVREQGASKGLDAAGVVLAALHDRCFAASRRRHSSSLGAVVPPNQVWGVERRVNGTDRGRRSDGSLPS